MAQLLLFFLLISSISPVAWAEFSNPSSVNGELPAWTAGERQVLAWESDLDEVNVTLWQEFPTRDGARYIAGVYASIQRETQVSEFDWIVQTYGANLGFSTEFFFWGNRDAVEDDFQSTHFTITRSDDDDEATATTSSGATLNPTSSPSASDSSSTDSDSDSGLTSTDKIALGVGIGLGIPILAALAVLIWLKVRGGSPEAAAAASTSNQPSAGVGASYVPPVELEQPLPVPKEVPGTPVYYQSELPERRPGE